MLYELIQEEILDDIFIRLIEIVGWAMTEYGLNTQRNLEFTAMFVKHCKFREKE